MQNIVKEINTSMEYMPDLKERQIVALYFGGGTANLSPDMEFDILCQILSENFDLSNAEITLEGVPAYFATLC